VNGGCFAGLVGSEAGRRLVGVGLAVGVGKLESGAGFGEVIGKNTGVVGSNCLSYCCHTHSLQDYYRNSRHCCHNCC